ncbi:MAG: hypothetical protein IPH69_04390 [Bacteroidales bacterium]|nr:hypothetical protein [Bacteroidales bacterium]MBK7625854.1 hypothetical protein [Bacteroidales bacterium]
MGHKNFYHEHEREHHPRVGVGLFFILLGAALLIATNDLLNLGSVSEYFTWQTVLIFIGALLLLNLQFVGGLIMIALGVWFLQDKIFMIPNDVFHTYYWPAVVGLVGLSFILSSFFKRRK